MILFCTVAVQIETMATKGNALKKAAIIKQIQQIDVCPQICPLKTNIFTLLLFLYIDHNFYRQIIWE